VRYRGRHIRRAIVVQEIVGTDPVTNELITNKLFAWNPKEDTFTFFGRSYTLEEISENTGMSEKDIWDEIERRKTVLRWMVKKRIANYLDVGALIREYYSNPEEMHARAVRELI
ncbi:MAG: secretion system protein E, partial [Asgard group archaeon]